MKDFFTFLINSSPWFKLFIFYFAMMLVSFVYMSVKMDKELQKIIEDNPDCGDLMVNHARVVGASIVFPAVTVVNCFVGLIDLTLEKGRFALLDLLYRTGICILNKLGGYEDLEGQQIEMTKDNVLLYEKHDLPTSEALSKNGKTVMVHGVKIFRVIKPENGEFNVIAQYKANEDRIDLSVLHKYVGFYMVSVDRDIYDHDKFVWNCMRLGEGDEKSDVFVVNNPRACTEEEVTMLNELFPEYYDHAF